MKKTGNISLKDATEELLKTSIFKNIAGRTNNNFARKLAIWLVRYVLIISSMNESLKINLETILLNLHGEKFKKIVQITDQTCRKVKEDTEEYNSYIW
jgi:hypothetical protein